MSMTPSEVAVFQAALQSASHYLEYGAGNSTSLAARTSGLSSITSVESDADFLSKHVLVDGDVAASLRAGRLKFLLVDIGPTGPWGYPRDTSRAYLWPNYALCPYLQGFRPDLVLVDGRFRVACGLVAALHVPDATVLIHDYPARPEYHVLEQFFNIKDTVGSLARCQRKPTIDEVRARSILKTSLYNPSDR